MAEVNLLKAREVREAVKNGLGLEHLCQKYGCDQAELSKRVNLLFSKNKKATEKIISDLKANDKKSKNQKSAPTTEAVTDSKPIDDSPTTPEEEHEESLNSKTLSDLQIIEEEESQKAIELENQHKKLAQEHKNKIRRLRDLKDCISEIKASFKAMCSEYEKIVLENNAIVSEMNEISDKHYHVMLKLEEIRERIGDMEKIVLFVYADGGIETDDDINLDDTNFEDILSVLLDKKECENLKLKDIKTLARTIAIVNNMDSTKRIEVMFDDAGIEEVYKAVRLCAT